MPLRPQPPNGGVWTVAQGDLWEPWVHAGTRAEPPQGAILVTGRRHPLRRGNRPRSGAPWWVAARVPGLTGLATASPATLTLGYGPHAPVRGLRECVFQSVATCGQRSGPRAGRRVRPLWAAASSRVSRFCTKAKRTGCVPRADVFRFCTKAKRAWGLPRGRGPGGAAAACGADGAPATEELTDNRDSHPGGACALDGGAAVGYRGRP